MLNSGVSGNRVLADAETPWPYGDAALARYGADALRLPGVTDLILMEGLNDLGNDDTLPANKLIDGLRRLVAPSRAGRTPRASRGPLPPTGGARNGEGHGSEGDGSTAAEGEPFGSATAASPPASWTSTSALRDPEDSSRLRPAYDSGDHLHPNSAGYRAMARAVRLGRLAGTGCV